MNHPQGDTLTDTPLRALLIEDVESDAALVVRQLTKSGYEVEWERVECAGQMRAALEKRDWDVIIADYQLPAFPRPRRAGYPKTSRPGPAVPRGFRAHRRRSRGGVDEGRRSRLRDEGEPCPPGTSHGAGVEGSADAAGEQERAGALERQPGARAISGERHRGPRVRQGPGWAVSTGQRRRGAGFRQTGRGLARKRRHGAVPAR